MLKDTKCTFKTIFTFITVSYLPLCELDGRLSNTEDTKYSCLKKREKNFFVDNRAETSQNKHMHFRDLVIESNP